MVTAWKVQPNPCIWIKGWQFRILYIKSQIPYLLLCPDSGSPFQKKQHNALTFYKQIRILIEPMPHAEFFTKKNPIK